MEHVSFYTLKDWQYLSSRRAYMSRSQVRINKTFQRNNVNIVLPTTFNICFGCSKEPYRLDRYFEYPQHMICLRNKKLVLLRTLGQRKL